MHKKLQFRIGSISSNVSPNFVGSNRYISNNCFARIYHIWFTLIHFEKNNPKRDDTDTWNFSIAITAETEMNFKFADEPSNSFSVARFIPLPRLTPLPLLVTAISAMYKLKKKLVYASVRLFLLSSSPTIPLSHSPRTQLCFRMQTWFMETKQMVYFLLSSSLFLFVVLISCNVS